MEHSLVERPRERAERIGPFDLVWKPNALFVRLDGSANGRLAWEINKIITDAFEQEKIRYVVIRVGDDTEQTTREHLFRHLGRRLGDPGLRRKRQAGITDTVVLDRNNGDNEKWQRPRP